MLQVSRSTTRGIRFPRLLFPAISLILLNGVAALAGTVWVNCPGESIHAALAGLSKTDPNTVWIAGICSESVLVENFTDLQLRASAPGAGIERTTEGEPALRIAESSVSLSGLTFQGGFGPYDWGPPLVEVSGSNASVSSCIIQGSSAQGIRFEEGSFGIIDGSTVQDNAESGIVVDNNSSISIVGTRIERNGLIQPGPGLAVAGHSRVDVSYWWGGPTLIQGNYSGIGANSGAVVYVGKVTIQENQYEGVAANNSAIVNLGTWGPDAPVVRANSTADPINSAAVVAGNAGEVWLISPVKVEENYATGAASSLGGRLVVCCGPETSISNNGRFGINAWMGGGVYFWGEALIEENKRGGLALYDSRSFINQVTIRGNGDPADSNSLGGIDVSMNSVLSLNGTVADNYGPGLKIAGVSIAHLLNTTITGNRGYGVYLELGSTAYFTKGAVVSGHKPFDLYCGAGAWAGAPKGVKVNIGKMNCPGWVQLMPEPQ